MFECLKDGYNFFAKYDKGNLIATLTLKEGDIYKDVVKLEDDELVFLYTFSNIESSLSDDSGLSVMYDSEKDKFISSIRNKTSIGEYNDKIVWNTKTSGEGDDFVTSLNNLENNLLVKTEERRFK